MGLEIYIIFIFIYMFLYFGIFPLIRGLYARSFLKSLDDKTIANNKLITYGRYRFRQIDKYVFENYEGSPQTRKLELFLKLMRLKSIILGFVFVNALYFSVMFSYNTFIGLN